MYSTASRNVANCLRFPGTWIGWKNFRGHRSSQTQWCYPVSSAAGERPDASAPIGMPYGPMSLWDMINCHISSLCGLCSQLRLYQIVLGDQPQASDGPDDLADGVLIENVRGWLKITKLVADDFELDAVRDRVATIEKGLSKRKPTNQDISTEMRVLLETVDTGLKNQLVYRYPREKGCVLFKWKDDWAAVTASFPATEEDICAGVDLWALGVFQFMRVLERGLKALASDVCKQFDVQNWQTIIDQIESEIRQLGKTLPSGTPKTERLQFLSEAAKEFVYFKDGWRNYVSHNRGAYDEHQARSVMEHVRAFMTTLASKLSEV
jgi:hypothetical protein